MSGQDKNPKRTAKSIEITADPKRHARRRLIQTLALGGGIASAKLIPNRWTAPAVDSVLIPAHARGSTCTLGNPTPVFVEVTPPAGPGPVEKIAGRFVDALVPEAAAADGPLYILTGCYWIEFQCGSNSGTFCATVESTLEDSENEIICAPFASGETEELEDFCFRVNKLSDEYAELFIGDGSCGDVVLGGPIELSSSNPNCSPALDDAGP